MRLAAPSSLGESDGNLRNSCHEQAGGEDERKLGDHFGRGSEQGDDKGRNLEPKNKDKAEQHVCGPAQRQSGPICAGP